MTPVASWSPADYYQASRAARRAWERTQPQMQLDVLEDGQVKRAAGLPAAACSSSSASHLHLPLAPVPPKRAVGDALDLTNDGPGRITPKVLRGRGQ